MPSWRVHLTRNFAYFWVARTAGMLANQMFMVALGWQMYDITSDPWDLGLVGLFQFVPALLLTLPAGHVADKFNRSRVFSASMLIQAAAALLLLLATVEQFATRELILVVSVALGVARAFQMPAQQALIPRLVPPEFLGQALALSASGLQAAIICGPALGGILYAIAPEQVYIITFVLLLLACLLMGLIQYQHHAPKEKASLKSLFAGVSFVWQNKILLGAVSLDLFAVLFGGAVALLPMFAKDILHVGPEGLGMLRAAPAVGAIAMSFFLLRWPVTNRAGFLLMTSVALFGVATIVFGLSESFLVSLFALAVTGAADSISVVIRQTLVQTETPDEIRGRVSAVNSIFIGASNQLGEFESGAIAAWIGAVGSVVWGGIGTLIVVVAWIFIFPALARRDQLVSKHG